jgi:PleD family two-component response regulator
MLSSANPVSQPAQPFVSPRLTAMRAHLCALAQSQDLAQRRFQLSALSTQCQWLASHARMAGFVAMAQVAYGLGTLTRDIHEQADRLTKDLLRHAAEAADLLATLAETCPAQAGRAEGARVLVLDADSRSRSQLLSDLETCGISGAGLASPEAALTVVARSSVDLIILKAVGSGWDPARVCQAIRRLSGASDPVVMVLSSKSDRDSRRELVASGASEVIPAIGLLGSELALSILVRFFRKRVGDSLPALHRSAVALLAGLPD